MFNKLKSINPYTLKENARYTELTPDGLEKKIEASERSFLSYRNSSVERRREALLNIAFLLDKEIDSLAKLICEEMGKLITEARAEIKKCASICRYYAANGEVFLTPKQIETESGLSEVYFRPLGPIFGVMPWNFPFWQVFRFAVPNLMAGNTILLKHASNVPGCSQRIEKLFLECGLDEGIFQSLLIKSDFVSNVIKDFRVRGVSFTGSTDVGRKIGSLAGQALKKSVLELGGSDPYIVLKDANLELAIDSSVRSRMLNTGQSCISAKRFIVHQSLKKDFISGMSDRLKKFSFADPAAEQTSQAPLSLNSIREQISDQVERAKAFGDRVVLGGKGGEHPHYYAATILELKTSDSPVFKEETFGPVAPVIGVESDEEALSLANKTSFGLGGAIFSRDSERAKELAIKFLNAGNIAINNFVRSDPRLPFGGVNDSGYGRELSELGIKEFLNHKTVSVS